MALPGDKFVLAIDLGSGGPKVALFSARCEIIARASAKTSTIFTPDGGGEQDPTHPEEELLESLAEAIGFVKAFLTERGASLDTIRTATGFARNAAIVKAKEAANENDETRKRFEVMCRAVFPCSGRASPWTASTISGMTVMP